MSDFNFHQPFASRTALPAGAFSFAGRRRVRKLLATLGATTTNSISVVGPRQSGRSSLLQQISYSEYLPPTLKDAIFVYASFREHRGEPQGAIGYLIRQLAQTLQKHGLPMQAVMTSGSMVDAVERALAVCPGRLIIIIDDFEAVGSDLQKDHQSDLRQAVYHQQRAGYVVASRLSLTRCLQEWGDNLSDFAPILTPMPELLEPLQRREIQEMLQQVLELPLESQLPELAARFVQERVGGFALWVQQALAILVEEELLSGTSLELSEARQHDIEMRISQRIQGDWLTSYRRLSPSAQRALEQSGESIDINLLDELRLAGWALPDSTREFKPAGRLLAQWLRNRPWEDILSPAQQREQEEDLYDKLVIAVDQLNTRYQRMTHKRKETIIRRDVFSSSRDVPFLRRKVRTEEDLGRLILSLARLWYDGTGGATDARKTLPLACYEDPSCIVRQVMTLRNAWIHLEHPNEAESQRNLEAETAVYTRYIGISHPGTEEERRQLADALRRETIRFAEELTKVCPFAQDLKLAPLLPRAP